MKTNTLYLNTHNIPTFCNILGIFAFLYVNCIIKLKLRLRDKRQKNIK